MREFTEFLLRFHVAIGVFTTFVVAPAALLAWKGGRVHRSAGQLYCWLMCLLYLTGSWRTWTLAPLGSGVFWRNLLFNLFGISLTLFGWRAAKAMRGGPAWPATGDRAASWALLVLGVAMLPVGLVHKPMFVFGLIALWLVWLDRGEFAQRRLWHRHVRFMLAGYFYVITVLSIVHAPFPGPRKWLWPTCVAIPVLYLASERGARRLRWTRAWLMTRAVRITLVTSFALGVYALIAVLS